ncbi:MAG: alkaline phosphatase family protein, partial [Deltaproteobacteria bacterium]|nr:alkaline phosphatase family protein [Deltaproteobacteria bacterium]
MLAVIVLTAAAYYGYTWSLQLPWRAALLLGSGAAIAVVVVVAIARRTLPPKVVFFAASCLLYGLLAGPASKVAPRVCPVLGVGVLLLVMPLSLISSRRVLRVTAALAVTLSLLGMWGYGSNIGLVALIVRQAPLSTALATTVREVVDFDGDGTSMLLGGTDCDDFDSARNPSALEVAGNNVDDNCNRYSLGAVHVPLLGDLAPAGGTFSLPASISRPDVIIISLDAVRPDHVTQETMPNLAALKKQGLRARVTYTVAPYTGHAVIGAMTSTPVIDHNAN